MVKILFFFSKLQQVLNKWIFSRSKISFNLVRSQEFNHRMRNFLTLLCPHCAFVTIHFQYIMKKAWVPAFFKVPIDHLFGNLESRKIKYYFWKTLEKVLNFGSKNLYMCRPWLQNVEIRWSGDVFNAST